MRIKRIYEAPASGDGYRVLIDRIWPRGISKEEAKLDEWLKDIAPSNELRKWFNHDPDLYPEFKKKYQLELKEHQEELNRLKVISKKQQLTLLFGAKDEVHNQAMVVFETLNAMS